MTPEEIRAEAERRYGEIASPGRKISARAGFVDGAEWVEKKKKTAEVGLEVLALALIKTVRAYPEPDASHRFTNMWSAMINLEQYIEEGEVYD